MVLAIAAGCLQACSLAWPVLLEFPNSHLIGLRAGQPVWWLQCLALALFFRLLLRPATGAIPDWRGGAIMGLVFATSWFVTTFGWTYVAMHTYGGLALLPAALAALALAGFLALYYAMACACLVRWADLSSRIIAISFSGFWLMAELARGTWFSGFAWGAVGYAHVEGPLSGFAPWIGGYGIAALAAWVAVVIAHLTTRQASRRRLPDILTLTAVLGTGYLLPDSAEMTRGAGTLQVALLQGNIPQDEKFETGSGVPIALQWYGEQLASSKEDLVIAPETAIPLLPEQLPPDYWSALRQRFQSGGQAALIGMPLGNFREGYSNSVVGLQPGQTAPWRYDKQHLVPFGEFIPPWFKWFTALMHIPLGDFNRGKATQPAFIWRGQALSANICYENLFSEQLAMDFAAVAAPTMLVNVSNLAWFGGTLAIDQHLQIARMRALEFGRPYLLATNTGPTAVVDHRGEVVASLPRDLRGRLSAQVEGRSGITPYAAWMARWGLWPYWFLAFAIIVMATWPRLTKR